MPELLAHLLGDYVLQNHWMAVNKTSRSWPALVHVLFYGLPFLAIGASFTAWLVIVASHFVIDRFRLAKLWVDFWGTGKAGALLEWIADDFDVDVPADAPPWMAVWLLIIVDNTAHLMINAFALRCL